MRIEAAAILLACSAASFAQDKPALRVVVEGEALECGIKPGAIESSAARALKSHGIQVSSDAKDPYLYVNVNAYRVMQGSTAVGCSTRLGVSVRAVPTRSRRSAGSSRRARRMSCFARPGGS